MKHILLITFIVTTALDTHADTSADKLVKAAIERTQHSVMYDGTYFSIPYPNGDVPAHKGVCTDVIIRSYRKIGIDLQQRVHEDISRHFERYPSKKIWGLTRPDKNIDHRRVPNLQVFLARFGSSPGITKNADLYKPGDIVTWLLPGNLPHIGIIINQSSRDGNRPLVAHNIGRGPEISDMLFSYRITGHYRYYGH